MDKVLFCAAHIEENKMWFVPDYSVGLFEFDFVTGKTTYLTRIPYTKKNIRQQVGAIVKHNNRLILAPYEADEVAVYDLIAKTVYTIPTEIVESHKFNSALIHQGFVYFIGALIPIVAKFNLETFSFEKFWHSHEGNGGAWSRGSQVIVDGKIIIPQASNGFYIGFDLSTNTFANLGTIDKDGLFNDLHHVDEVLWLFSRNKNIISYRSEEWDEWKKVTIDRHFYVGGKLDRTTRVNQMLILYDEVANSFFAVDTKDKSIARLDYTIQSIDELQEYIGHRIIWMGSQNEEILLLKSNGELLSYNFYNHMEKRYLIEVTKRDRIRYYSDERNWDEAVLEDEMGIELLFETIEKGKQKKKLLDSDVGHAIYYFGRDSHEKN